MKGETKLLARRNIHPQGDAMAVGADPIRARRALAVLLPELRQQLTQAVLAVDCQNDNRLAGIETVVDENVPALPGLTARFTVAPPAAAGMSSVTVNVRMLPGLIVTLGGDSVTLLGCSATSSTRT